MDLKVLQDFLVSEDRMREAARLIREGTTSGEFLNVGESVSDIDEMEGAEATEGRLLERRHFARERNPSLRAKKIQKHLRTHGRLACHCCGFDFRAAYGEQGDGYIECHHVVPLHASGETQTRLDDLVLICANCHRMIHRRSPWLTPGQLQQLVTDHRDA
jgi:5-methylcytosine-specific restriction protein A